MIVSSLSCGDPNEGLQLGRKSIDILPRCWFWRFILALMIGRILGVSRLAKGWRVGGVMVRAAMASCGK